MKVLPGIARKIAIPFILLSLAGWILFGVGFGIRNFTYKELSDQAAPITTVTNLFGSLFGTLQLPTLDHAAKPEFFLFWAFAIGGLIVYILSFVYVFWDHAISKLLINIFVPVFLLGAGGVMLVDGLLIYLFYQRQNGFFVGFYCTDIYNIVPDASIHDEEKYAPIEFAGAMVALLFYWIFLLISSFFATAKKVYT